MKKETMVSVRIRKDGYMADGAGHLKVDMSYQLPVSRLADLWIWLDQVAKRKSKTNLTEL